MPRKSTKNSEATGKAKAVDKKVSENLRKIYENADGSMPDMSTMERKRGGAIWRALLSVSVLGGLTLLGFWAWNTQINPRLNFANELAVDLTGPTLVAPGATSEYTVRYRNPGNTAVEAATLYFEHPSGFLILSSSKPLSEDGQKIMIGDLDRNASGEVKVSGVWAVDANTTSTLNALLTYTPANFSSVFEKKNSIEVVSSESAVQFVWTAPAASNIGKQTSVGLIVKSALPFAPNTRLQITPPAEFTVSGSEPKSDDLGRYEWKMPTSTNTFNATVKGAFTASSSPAFSATVRGFVSTTPVILGKSIQTAPVAQTKNEVVVLTVFDKNDMVSAVPGTVLPIKMIVSNASANAFNNASITLNITAPSYQSKSILNWQKFVDENNGEIKGEQISPELRRGIITWTGKEIKQLQNFAIGATIPLSVSIPIKSGSETDLSNFASSTIMVTAELRDNGFLVGEASEPVIINIISDTAFSTKAERTDSTYAVTWLLTNSFHELKDVRVEGDLYGNFTWDESSVAVPAGKITFDPKTKKLTWTIPKLVTSVDAAALKFPLNFAKINPTQKDLSGPITLTAIDAETGGTISLSVPAIKAQ